MQLETVELDLNFADHSLGEIEIKEEIERQLDAIFSPILQKLKTKEAQQSKDATLTPITVPTDSNNSSQVSSEDRERISLLRPEVRHQKSVLYFLEKGQAPWWISSHEEMRKLLTPEAIQKLLSNKQLTFISLLGKLLNSSVIRRRLIRQFSTDTVLTMLKRIAESPASLFKELPDLIGNSTFESAVNKLKASDKMYFLDLIIRSSINSASDTKLDLKKAWATVLHQENKSILPKVKNAIVEIAPAFVKALEEDDSIDLTTFELKDLTSQTAEEKSKEETNSDKQYNEIVTENAGLVLLNPFIKPFFSSINLLEEDGSLTDPVQAAHIFHYLATGEEEDFEFALIFEAFLCGLPINEPLPKSVPLTDDIKDECHKLLMSVLGHWKALKSQSIPLLRKEFLQRSGKLIVNETTPRVVIERSGLDILMDKLPWSISMLQPPWRDELIYVEW